MPENTDTLGSSESVNIVSLFSMLVGAIEANASWVSTVLITKTGAMLKLLVGLALLIVAAQRWTQQRNLKDLNSHHRRVIDERKQYLKRQHIE